MLRKSFNNKNEGFVAGGAVAAIPPQAPAAAPRAPAVDVEAGRRELEEEMEARKRSIKFLQEYAHVKRILNDYSSAGIILQKETVDVLTRAMDVAYEALSSADKTRHFQKYDELNDEIGRVVAAGVKQLREQKGLGQAAPVRVAPVAAPAPITVAPAPAPGLVNAIPAAAAPAPLSPNALAFIDACNWMHDRNNVYRAGIEALSEFQGRIEHANQAFGKLTLAEQAGHDVSRCKSNLDEMAGLIQAGLARAQAGVARTVAKAIAAADNADRHPRPAQAAYPQAPARLHSHRPPSPQAAAAAPPQARAGVALTVPPQVPRVRG